MSRMLQKISLCVLTTLGLFLPTLSSFAEESTSKPVAIVSFAGYDSFWDGVEKVADLLGYKDSVVATRTIAADVQGLDKTAPFGFVLSTDGDSIFPFGFLPIASLDDLEFVGSEDLKSEIETTDDGKTIEINGTKIELVEKDGWLFLCEPGKADKLPAGDPAELLEGLNKDYLFAAKVFGKNVPTELINNLLAPVRQQMAEMDSNQGELFDFQMDYFFQVVAEIESVTTGLKINPESGDLVLDVVSTAVPGSVIAEACKAASQGFKTQWGACFDPKNSVLSAIGSGQISERDAKYLKEYYQRSFDNILAQLDLINETDDESEDDEDATDDKSENDEAIQTAKKSVEMTRDFLVGYFGSANKIDYFLNLTQDPQIVLGTSSANATQLLDILKNAVAYFEKENSDFVKKYIKIAAGEFEGYSVSSFSFPFVDIEEINENADVPEWLIDKQAAVILAIQDDSILFVAGLDKKAVSDKFKKVAKTAKTETDVPKRYAVFSVANLGKMLKNLNLPAAADPEVAAIFDKISEAGPDALLYAELLKATETSVAVQEVFAGQNFVLIGDIIRWRPPRAASDEETDDELNFDEEDDSENGDEAVEVDE